MKSMQRFQVHFLVIAGTLFYSMGADNEAPLPDPQPVLQVPLPGQGYQKFAETYSLLDEQKFENKPILRRWYTQFFNRCKTPAERFLELSTLLRGAYQVMTDISPTSPDIPRLINGFSKELMELIKLTLCTQGIYATICTTPPAPGGKSGNADAYEQWAKKYPTYALHKFKGKPILKMWFDEFFTTDKDESERLLSLQTLLRGGFQYMSEVYVNSPDNPRLVTGFVNESMDLIKFTFCATGIYHKNCPIS